MDDAGLRELEDKELQHLIQLEAIIHITILNPEGVFKRRCDLLQVLFLRVLLRQFRIGFDVSVPIWTTYFCVDAFIDLNFIFGIFLNFRISKVEQVGSCVFQYSDISKFRFLIL